MNDTTWTFSVTPSAQGAVTVELAAGAAEDRKGNDSTLATKSITYDTAGATPTISSTETSPTDETSIPISVVFDEAVVDFSLADISVGNGTPSNFQGSGTTYSFTITPTANGAVTVNIAAGVPANDLAGNPSLVATEFTIVSDTGDPSVQLSTSAGTPTNLQAIPFQAVFSEAVNDFIATDITVTNGTVSNFQGSGTTYTFDVTPTADGDVTVAINAGVARRFWRQPEHPGHADGARLRSHRPDRDGRDERTQPHLEQPDGLLGRVQRVSIRLHSGRYSGRQNGAVTNFAGSGTSYTFQVVPSGNNVQVEVSVPAGVATDAAANGNSVSNTVIRQFSGTTVSTNLSTSSSDPTSDDPIEITVEFGENVTGFDLADINVTNGTASNLVATDGNTYTFDVSPTTDGPVVVDVVAGAATGDVSGDPTSARTADDHVGHHRAGATITGPTSPSNDPTMQFSIQFTEAVTGFELADITVSNGSASNLQGSGASYTFDVTPIADGDVVVSVAAGLVADDAGNTNTAVPQVTVVSDTTAPTATITAPNGPTNDDPIQFSVIFSESVTGLELADIVVENGTASNLQGSGTTYTFDVAPTADGAVNVSIIANAASDAAGNGNPAAGPATVQSDQTNPQVTVNNTAAGAITGTSTDASGVAGVEISIFNGTNYLERVGI